MQTVTMNEQRALALARATFGADLRNMKDETWWLMYARAIYGMALKDAGVEHLQGTVTGRFNAAERNESNRPKSASEDAMRAFLKYKDYVMQRVPHPVLSYADFCAGYLAHAEEAPAPIQTIAEETGIID